MIRRKRELTPKRTRRDEARRDERRTQTAFWQISCALYTSEPRPDELLQLVVVRDIRSNGFNSIRRPLGWIYLSRGAIELSIAKSAQSSRKRAADSQLVCNLISSGSAARFRPPL